MLHLPTKLRQVARKVVESKVAAYARRHRRPDPGVYRASLTGKSGLEIGGPSDIFGDAGLLPIYRALATLDNCLYSTQTIWTGNVQATDGFHYHPHKPAGAQIIREATELTAIDDSSYGCVLASHCLEHVANPLRALAEWKRVLVPDGLLLLVLPHRDGTFDWQRPTTHLSHMVEDFQDCVGEDDLTHLPEILALHDLGRDKAAGSKQQFEQRSLQNRHNRALHHHVFDTWTAAALVDRAAFQLLRVDVAKPYHIIILAGKSDGTRDNSAFLGPHADFRLRSCFPSDRLPDPK